MGTQEIWEQKASSNGGMYMESRCVETHKGIGHPWNSKPLLGVAKVFDAHTQTQCVSQEWISAHPAFQHFATNGCMFNCSPIFVRPSPTPVGHQMYCQLFLWAKQGHALGVQLETNMSP
ncbi:unnamed protein product [Durusdinium trenchii]|uniref:Uncharacterized protein n=1 Tax=Durusdinium trenchii TaxID=1381693 RepID=A0ABP0IPQ1_9DINO